METITDSSGILGAVESLIGGREENQDSYGMAETRLGMLAVVCDGMGGGPAGKTASSIATQAIIDYVSGAEADKSPASVLEDAAVSANESLLAAVAENPALKGMGTTCVCVLIQHGKAFIMHVGDSRCYLLRGEKDVFRTADHSYVGELVRRGSMTEEEARQSNFSNVITRALGATPTVDPEVDVVDIKPGDRFALMTDGIWGTMPEQQLVGVLAYDESPEKLVPLITARVDAVGVQEGGGHDNLTLALVQLPGGGSNKVAPAVLNDLFGSNRPTRTGRVAPSPVTSAAPEGADGGEADSNKEKKGKSHLLVWMLSAALVVAIGVIIWLAVVSSEEAKEIKSEKAIAEQVDNIVDNRTPKAEQEEVETTEQTPEAQPEAKVVEKSVAESPESKNEQDKVAKIQEAGAKDAPKADKVPAVVDPVINDVIVTLLSLKEYKPDPKKAETKDEVEGQRYKIYKGAIAKLAEYSTSLPEGRREKVKALADEMKKNANVVKMVEKGKHWSTKDANDAIDRHVAKLKELGK